MSLIDDVRRTVTGAANTALEKGQQAAELVRLQAKLQHLTRERGRKMHELGARTYDWFQSGAMIVSGPVPPNVVDLCHQLQSLNTEVDETQRQFDEAKSRAAAPLTDAGQGTNDPPLVSSSVSAQSASTQSTSEKPHGTQPLSQQTPSPQPPASGGIPLPPSGVGFSQAGPSDP